MEHGDRRVVLQQMLNESQCVDLHVGRSLLLAEGVLYARDDGRDVVGEGSGEDCD